MQADIASTSLALEITLVAASRLLEAGYWFLPLRFDLSYAVSPRRSNGLPAILRQPLQTSDRRSFSYYLLLLRGARRPYPRFGQGTLTALGHCDPRRTVRIVLDSDPGMHCGMVVLPHPTTQPRVACFSAVLRHSSAIHSCGRCTTPRAPSTVTATLSLCAHLSGRLVPQVRMLATSSFLQSSYDRLRSLRSFPQPMKLAPVARVDSCCGFDWKLGLPTDTSSSVRSGVPCNDFPLHQGILAALGDNTLA